VSACRRPRDLDLPSLAELGDDPLDVPAHLRARLRGVVGRQGVENVLVIGDRGFSQRGGVEVFFDLFPHGSMTPIPDGADDLRHHRVPRSGGDGDVKCLVRDLIRALVVQRVLHPDDGLEDCVQVRVLGRDRGRGTDAGLDDQATAQQLERTGGVFRLRRGRPHRADVDPGPRPHFHDAADLERNDRFPQGGAADLEAFGQQALRREAIPGTQLTARDHFGDLLSKALIGALVIARKGGGLAENLLAPHGRLGGHANCRRVGHGVLTHAFGGSRRWSNDSSWNVPLDSAEAARAKRGSPCAHAGKYCSGRG